MSGSYASGQAAVERNSRLQVSFEAQVKRTPAAIAVACDGKQMSYEDLNVDANRLARYLRRLGVGLDVRVGICMERSIEMVTSIIAVLKAGGAYVPLDPEYPQERLKYIIEDAESAILLTVAKQAGSLPGNASKIVCVDAERDKWGGEDCSDPDCSDPDCVARAESLAYVIYTSGSTGLPKGVCIPHEGIYNHMRWIQDTFRFHSSDRFLQKTPFTFDASVLEFYAPWLCGGTLVMARPGGHRDPDYLISTMVEQEITLLQVVPSQLRMLVEAEGLEECRKLRHLFCGGEALEKKVLERAAARLGNGVRITNLYGPTECSIDATFWTHTGNAVSEIIPIGKPITNIQTYVINPSGETSRAGECGELYLGGLGLARGYLQRPDLTAEKFVPDPFSGKPGARLYKTGDLVRLNEKDDLEYIRRIDHQIKIRGYRIELEEIESVLTSHASVRQAVVEAWGSGEGKRLAGYVVPSQQTVEIAELRQYMMDRLPEYMVPAALVVLEQLPLTTNGKLDRKSLPEPTEWAQSATEFEEPATEVEKQIAQIWRNTLRTDRVGRHDSFFALGGHSLLATVALARVRHELKVTVPVRVMFEEPTIAGIAAYIQNRKLKDTEMDVPRPFPRNSRLPLSFSQERVWFMEKLHPGNLAYNFQSLLHFRGKLSIPALEQALREIVRRHEIFRTTCEEINGQLVQVIHEPYAIELLPIDVQHAPDSESELRNLIQRELKKPFNLQQLPLIYWKLYRVDPEHHVLLHKEHHMGHDGWSFNLFVKELFELYRAFCTGKVPELATPAIQFADFSIWQREWIKGPEAAKQLDFWRQKLLHGPEVLALPWDRPRPPILTHRGAAPRIEVPLELCAALRNFCRERKVTLFMSMFTAYLVLMHRLSGAEDICIGSAIANRRWKETEDLIGMLVNNVVLRTDVSDNPSLEDLLVQVKEVTLEAFANQDVPFDRVVDALHPKRDLSVNPLFQVMFSFHDSPICEFNLPNLKAELIDTLTNGSAKWDMNIIAIPRAEQRIGHAENGKSQGITILWEYSSDLFERATIDRWIALYLDILRCIVTSPQQRIDDLLLSDSEFEETLAAERSATRTTPKPALAVHQLFEKQVKKTPYAVAVACGEEVLSYRDLNAKSNQLAHYLREQGIGPESLVAICMEPGTEFIISLLGVLKAGGAYVPINSEYPAERVDFMLKDAGVKLALTSPCMTAVCATPSVVVIAPQDEQEKLQKYSSENPEVCIGGNNLVYVIYTSGSMGTPKGVLVTHAGLTNYLEWAGATYSMGQGGKGAPLHSSIAFDLTVTSIFEPLLHGEPVQVVNAGAGLERLSKNLRQKPNYSLIKLTPSHLRLLRQQLDGRDLAEAAQSVIIGGEALLGEDAMWWKKAVPRVRIFNEYGPTETVVGCSLYELNLDFPGGPVPIGKPITSMQLYVLDRNMRQVPRGVTGEIYIGGVGVARGYRGRPDLTAERFLPDPYGTEAGGRLYRTGDKARRLSSGDLEYLGRADQQVKIRGFRIELGEIEVILGQHAGVRECAVLAEKDAQGEKQVVAYVVTRGSVSKQELREYMNKKLPEYMVPAAIVALESMPLTGNGKLDRQALMKEAAIQRQETSEGYVASRDELERDIAAIWADLLAMEKVGIHDNFFDLGGNSFMLAQVSSRTKQMLDVNVSLQDLFSSPTVHDLSRLVSHQLTGERAPRKPVTRRNKKEVPVSTAQQSLWFMKQVTLENPFYNIPVAFHITGILDLAALEASVNTIIRRHEILRTHFRTENGEALQIVEPQLAAHIEIEDLSSVPAPARKRSLERRLREEASTGFDLERLPLLRLRLFRISPEDQVLLLVIHHIIADGWSLGVFYRELSLLYAAHHAGNELQLSDLQIQYGDYALWERERLNDKELQEDLQYWRKKLEGAPEVLNLGGEHLRPELPTYHGATERFEIGTETCEAIRTLAREAGVTLHMMLLAAYAVLLQRASGEEEIVIGVPVANRNQEELQELIGLFVNMLPIRIDLRGDPSFRDLLKRVKTTVLEAYAHQDLPFELLVKELRPERDVRRNPVFQVIFNLFGNEQQVLKLSDVETVPVDVDINFAKFDLNFAVEEHRRRLVIRVIYNTDLFGRSAVEAICPRFELVIQQILSDLDCRTSKFDLLLPAEKSALNETTAVADMEESFLL